MNECPECGSKKIVKNAEIKDPGAGGSARVYFHQEPSAIFSRSVNSGTKADVCGDCGYLQIYAMDPTKLWQAYQAANSDVE